MTPYWMMTSAFDVAERVMQLDIEANPPRLVVTNGDVLAEFYQDVVQPRIEAASATGLARLDTLPPPVMLTITEPGFAPDYFNNGFEFVSARARAAMALGENDVQWLPVDASQSTEQARAQDYRVLHLVRTADPFDHDATDGEMTTYLRADGGTAQRWAPRHAGPNDQWPKIAWRADFTPPAPLFRASPTGVALATEAFAARVRDAGIRDITFLDMTNDGSRTEPVLFRPD